MRGRLLVGTSGWSYRSWRGDFYPPEVSSAHELEFLSRRTTSTEINASFYRLQRPESYRRWREETPDDHVFAVKGSRFITHMKRLRDCEAPLARFLASGVRELDDKLDVLLWQLPASLAFDRHLVAEFLRTVPADLRHAIEPRHPSFGREEARLLLGKHDVATVHSDSPGAWPAFDEDTASFRYVRLHGHSELYASRYADATLDSWARRCERWLKAGQDVYVYFDNDAHGHAPHDATRLLAKVRATDPVR